MATVKLFVEEPKLDSLRHSKRGEWFSIFVQMTEALSFMVLVVSGVDLNSC